MTAACPSPGDRFGLEPSLIGSEGSWAEIREKEVASDRAHYPGGAFPVAIVQGRDHPGERAPVAQALLVRIADHRMDIECELTSSHFGEICAPARARMVFGRSCQNGVIGQRGDLLQLPGTGGVVDDGVRISVSLDQQQGVQPGLRRQYVEIQQFDGVELSVVVGSAEPRFSGVTGHAGDSGYQEGPLLGTGHRRRDPPTGRRPALLLRGTADPPRPGRQFHRCLDH